MDGLILVLLQCNACCVVRTYRLLVRVTTIDLLRSNYSLHTTTGVYYDSLLSTRYSLRPTRELIRINTTYGLLRTTYGVVRLTTTTYDYLHLRLRPSAAATTYYDNLLRRH